MERRKRWIIALTTTLAIATPLALLLPRSQSLPGPTQPRFLKPFHCVDKGWSKVPGSDADMQTFWVDATFADVNDSFVKTYDHINGWSAQGGDSYRWYGEPQVKGGEISIQLSAGKFLLETPLAEGSDKGATVFVFYSHWPTWERVKFWLADRL